MASSAAAERLGRAAVAAGELLAGARSARLALAHAADLVPGPVREELPRRLRERLDDAQAAGDEPLRPREVEALLRAAWGSPPGKVLDDLDPDPVAVRPAGQVHRGTLDGAPVAVKVLRPGLAALVRSDLAVVEQAARIAAGALPRLDAATLVAELRERLMDELDLEHEASVQRAFARALRRSERFHVPAPVSDLCHEEVLVAAWVDGRAVDALGRDGDEAQRAAAAEALLRFHIGAGRFGTVHADPDPRDALLMDDGRLAVLDLGAVRRVEAARVDLAAQALDGVLERDAPALERALAALGWLPDASPGDAALALEHARHVLGPFLDGPALLDDAALVAAMIRAAEVAPDAAPLAARTAVPAKDLWPLRMLGQLPAALAPLRARLDWPALARESVAGGWE